MKQTDFELLQPVSYGHVTGYISFISEYYITICFKDIPLPKSANSRWGRHYVNIVVYPEFWHEVRSCVMRNKKKGTSRQEAIFYNLDDAALWEQHINKTEHCRTDIIPIYGDS